MTPAAGNQGESIYSPVNSDSLGAALIDLQRSSFLRKLFYPYNILTQCIPLFFFLQPFYETERKGRRRTLLRRMIRWTRHITYRITRIHGHAHIYVTGHFWRFKICIVYMGMPNAMRVYGHAHINEIGFRQKIVKTD